MARYFASPANKMPRTAEAVLRAYYSFYLASRARQPAWAVARQTPAVSLSSLLKRLSRYRPGGAMMMWRRVRSQSSGDCLMVN